LPQGQVESIGWDEIDGIGVGGGGTGQSTWGDGVASRLEPEVARKRSSELTIQIKTYKKDTIFSYPSWAALRSTDGNGNGPLLALDGDMRYNQNKVKMYKQILQHNHRHAPVPSNLCRNVNLSIRKFFLVNSCELTCLFVSNRNSEDQILLMALCFKDCNTL
jgi:hypothetical protein